MVKKKNSVAHNGDVLLERLREILVTVLLVDEADITSEATLVEDLGTNSLDLVELVMDVEDRFDIYVPEDRAVKMVTVQDLYDLVKELTSEEQPTTLTTRHDRNRADDDADEVPDDGVGEFEG